MHVGRWGPTQPPPLGSVSARSLIDCAAKCLSLEGIRCRAAALVDGECRFYPIRVTPQNLVADTGSHYFENPLDIVRI